MKYTKKAELLTKHINNQINFSLKKNISRRIFYPLIKNENFSFAELYFSGS